MKRLTQLTLIAFLSTASLAMAEQGNSIEKYLFSPKELRKSIIYEKRRKNVNRPYFGRGGIVHQL